MRKKELKKEIIRQLIHLSFGLCGIANMYFDLIRLRYVIIIYILGIILFLNINFAKLKFQWLDTLINYFERRKSLVGQGIITLGFSYIALHSIAVINSDLLQISIASMAIISYGDSTGTIFGILIDKFKLPYNQKKNLVGLTFGIGFAILSSMLFVGFIHAALASIFSMTLESLDLKIKSLKFDDNILIPTTSFIILYLLSLI